MEKTLIPEQIINYNLYNEAEKLVGITGEVTLPALEMMTETVSGAGIAGEYESAIPGHFGSMPIDISFRMLNESSVSLLKESTVMLTLRASHQSYDVSSGKKLRRPLKVVIRGITKSLELGKVEVGKPTESKVSVEVLYIKVSENDKVLVEIDKLNMICVIDGKDILEDVRGQI
jgi:P2 family phage contractile tail tube protein